MVICGLCVAFLQRSFLAADEFFLRGEVTPLAPSASGSNGVTMILTPLGPMLDGKPFLSTSFTSRSSTYGVMLGYVICHVKHAEYTSNLYHGSCLTTASL